MNKERWRAQYETKEWITRRSEILEKAKATCVLCGGAATQANHKWYLKDRKPWEYDDAQLEAICKACHRQTTERQELLRVMLSYVGAVRLPEIIGDVLYYLLVDGVAFRTVTIRDIPYVAESLAMRYTCGEESVDLINRLEKLLDEEERITHEEILDVLK